MKTPRKTEPDLLIKSKPYTEAERKKVSEYIAKSKAKAAKEMMAAH